MSSKSIIDYFSPALFTLRAAALIANGTETGTGVRVGGHYRRFIILCTRTACGTDAGDSLNIYVDCSLDNSTWFNALRFTSVAGTGAATAKEIAILDPSNPGTSVVVVTSDQASATVAPAVWGPYMRCRAVCVDADGNNTFNFSVVAYGQT